MTTLKPVLRRGRELLRAADRWEHTAALLEHLCNPGPAVQISDDYLLGLGFRP